MDDTVTFCCATSSFFKTLSLTNKPIAKTAEADTIKKLSHLFVVSYNVNFAYLKVDIRLVVFILYKLVTTCDSCRMTKNFAAWIYVCFSSFIEKFI